MKDKVEYFVNRGTESEIFSHLSACNAEFVHDLAERVDIKEYSKKIYTRSERFEAWSDDTLVGLVAAYCNDQTGQMAYITSVSVLDAWQGKGIAAKLISRCIEHARIQGMRCITLEVARGNAPAKALYEKYGFVVSDAEGMSIIMKLCLGTR